MTGAVAELVTVCAWCEPERARDAPEGSRVSHGMCPDCEAELENRLQLFEWVERIREAWGISPRHPD